MKDLNAVQIARLKSGLHRVSRGLYVRVTPNGSRSFIHRYHNGKAHEMGLGSCDIVTLAKARDAVIDARRLLLQGIDPIQARRRPTTQQTFADVAKLFIAAHWTDWTEKHAKQWPASFARYVYPVIGDLPIDKLTTGDVLRTLQPIWGTIRKSADNIRERISKVWDYAKALKWVTGENPAAWRGNLQPLLADISTIEVEHYPALPWQQMPDFMAELRTKHKQAARAVEMCVLTAVRRGAVLAATWSEIDTARGVWTIPAAHMKGKRGKQVEFKVPLSARVITLLEAMQRGTPDERVFPMWHSAMLETIKVFGRVDTKGKPISLHGFRSSFQDWATETTVYPQVVIDMALAHAIGNKVEAAYRRGDLYAQRMSLMADWATYCDG